MDTRWVETEVVLENTYGLHMRPAKKFLDLAQKFKAEVRVSRADAPEEEVDGRSIMGLIGLTATRGTRIRLRSRGEDGEEAANALSDLVRSFPKLFNEEPQAAE